MNALKVAILLGLAIVTMGCETHLVGSGPISLPPGTQEAFEKYLKNNPTVFAVSLDGHSYGYIYCPTKSACKGNKSYQAAVDLCEKNSEGIPCRVYASKYDIIWKHGG